MKIVKDLSLSELKEMMRNFFGDMVKGVIDIDRRLIAVDAQLHVDLELIMLEDGSKQNNLWGINFYPELFSSDDFIEFDSMINIRPSFGNSSRNIEDEKIKNEILAIVKEAIK